LEELLKRNKIQTHLKSEEEGLRFNISNDKRNKIKSSYVRNDKHKTEPKIFEIAEEDPYLSPSFKNIQTPSLQKRMSERLSMG
jgi:hypothetical protein